MSSEYITNMKDLLTSIKNLYKSYGNGVKGTLLSDIKTYKRGILGSATVYDSITVFPVREVIIQRRSDHFQIVERTVNT